MIEITDDGAVRVLALNRPEVLNAFNGGLFDALVESLLDADADESGSVVVITGAGRAFTAGADLSEMGKRAAQPKHGFAGLCETLIAYGKPVIVAANGASVGVGGTIMGLVDVVYVADSKRGRIHRFGADGRYLGVVVANLRGVASIDVPQQGAFAGRLVIGVNGSLYVVSPATSPEP